MHKHILTYRDKEMNTHTDMNAKDLGKHTQKYIYISTLTNTCIGVPLPNIKNLSGK